MGMSCILCKWRLTESKKLQYLMQIPFDRIRKIGTLFLVEKRERERERERERGLNELYFKHQNRMEHFWDHHRIISGELPAPKGDGCVSG